MNPCAWCDQEEGITRPPETSHTICARHAAGLVADYESDSLTEPMARIDQNGHRWDRIAFSVAVLGLITVLGLFAGAAFAVWQALGRLQ